MGTAASLRGVATVLKRHKPSIWIVAVEPAESPVLLGGQPGPHKIEGVGIGYVPPLWEPALVDEVVPVRTDDAKEMARRIAREEALFAGTSSGANVLAAIRVAERLGPDATGGHADGRLRPEVPEHRRLPAKIGPLSGLTSLGRGRIEESDERSDYFRAAGGKQLAQHRTVAARLVLAVAAEREVRRVREGGEKVERAARFGPDHLCAQSAT